jgi:hypothetical protein
MQTQHDESIKIAVVYYSYNRSDKTKISLPKILEYRKDLPLYIFCDGPKTQSDKEVSKVVNYVETTCSGQKKINATFRTTNLGLAVNVITGVNQIFKEGYDAVVVLEDDCIPKKDFFNFMITALNFYKKNDKVMHVSGFGIPLKNMPTEDSYVTPYPCSWGWGTWKENWEACNFNDGDYYSMILTNHELKDYFDWSGKSFSSFLDLQLNEKVNSWLIRWYAHIFKSKGVCVWSTISKIENKGFDGTGEHKVRFDRFNQKNDEIKGKFDFKNDLNFNINIIKEFRRFFMGPKYIDKLKTVIYIYTGLIFDKFKDHSSYYKND